MEMQGHVTTKVVTHWRSVSCCSGLLLQVSLYCDVTMLNSYLNVLLKKYKFAFG